MKDSPDFFYNDITYYEKVVDYYGVYTLEFDENQWDVVDKNMDNYWSISRNYLFMYYPLGNFGAYCFDEENPQECYDEAFDVYRQEIEALGINLQYEER